MGRARENNAAGELSLARGKALDRGAKVSALAKIGSLARATAVSRCQRYPALEFFLRSRSLSAYSFQA